MAASDSALSGNHKRFHYQPPTTGRKLSVTTIPPDGSASGLPLLPLRASSAPVIVAGGDSLGVNGRSMEDPGPRPSPGVSVVTEHGGDLAGC
jgi:hypothetical protein